MSSEAESNEVVLKVEHLTKHYPVKAGVFGHSDKVVHALEDVSFELHRGETFAIVGESGCGKSTTGKCILRLTEPTSGKVILDGEDFTALKGDALTKARQKMKLIFQDPYSSLNPRMTVSDIIAEPIDIAGIYKTKAERDARVEEIMKAVGLDLEFKYRYPHEFSGGQRQRIGIARALAVDPECVFCDEPISALDVSVQVQIVNMMQRQQQERGLSYLFIAHDLAMVHHMSRRMGVMYLGRLVELGPGDAVFHDPLHPYTQMLIASVPRPDPHYRRRTIVCGEVPSPLDLPKGCVFHPRCPYADEVCRIDVPHFRQVADDRFVACHHARGGRR